MGSWFWWSQWHHKRQLLWLPHTPPMPRCQALHPIPACNHRIGAVSTACSFFISFLMISLPDATACIRSFTAFFLLGPRGLCTICVPQWEECLEQNTQTSSTCYPGNRHKFYPHPLSFLQLSSWPEVTPVAQILTQLYFRALLSPLSGYVLCSWAQVLTRTPVCSTRNLLPVK